MDVSIVPILEREHPSTITSKKAKSTGKPIAIAKAAEGPKFAEPVTSQRICQETDQPFETPDSPFETHPNREPPKTDLEKPKIQTVKREVERVNPKNGWGTRRDS